MLKELGLSIGNMHFKVEREDIVLKHCHCLISRMAFRAFVAFEIVFATWGPHCNLESKIILSTLISFFLSFFFPFLSFSLCLLSLKCVFNANNYL